MSVLAAAHRPARSHARTSPQVESTTLAIEKARTPAAAHVTRYPAANINGDSGERLLVMREYNATVGATDGNIIAAIITIQTERNQPKVPRPVQGPLSIPCIWSAVHHQPAAASANSTTTSPRRVRTAE